MEFSGKLDRDKILEIAGSVGIDRAQLEKDMEDPKLKADHRAQHGSWRARSACAARRPS